MPQFDGRDRYSNHSTKKPTPGTFSKASALGDFALFLGPRAQGTWPHSQLLRGSHFQQAIFIIKLLKQNEEFMEESGLKLATWVFNRAQGQVQ